MRLTVDEIFAIATTDDYFRNTRDEIFFEVRVRSPDGLFEGYSPLSNYEEDYYEFVDGRRVSAAQPTGWTNDYQHVVYPPQLWEGLLPRNGNEAVALVVMYEQDDDSIDDAKALISIALGTCTAIADGLPLEEGGEEDRLASRISNTCESGRELANYLPDEDPHDLVGAVVVTMLNDGGELEVTFTAVGSDALSELGLPPSSSRTELLESDGAPVVMTLASRDGVRALFATTSTEHPGRYEFSIKALPICASEREPRRMLWNDDVERGNCDNRQPVNIWLPDGSRSPLDGAIYVRTDLPYPVHYWCDGSEENEGILFRSREYREYLVRRTRDTIDYYPYTFVGFDGVGLTADPLLSDDATSVGADFRLARDTNLKRLTWSPATAAEVLRCDQAVVRVAGSVAAFRRRGGGRGARAPPRW